MELHSQGRWGRIIIERGKEAFSPIIDYGKKNNRKEDEQFDLPSLSKGRGTVCQRQMVDEYAIFKNKLKMYPYNKKLIGNAQALRKNMTPEEKHLWYDFLKKLPVSVKRQKNIENYIVDFYIPQAKLVIELDGIQHKKPENKEADRERDLTLESYGITVLRYSNKIVNEDFDHIVKEVLRRLGLTYEDIKKKVKE